MSLHVWYRPLNGIGEACADLASGVRWVCAVMGPDADYDLHIYEVEGPGTTGRDAGHIWLRYFGSSEGDDYSGFYEEVHGEEAAYIVLQNSEFRGRLTEALRRYEEYGDLRTYREWSDSIRATAEVPRWEDGTRTFSWGEFRRVLAPQARNQAAVLRVLQAANWKSFPVSVNIPKNRLYEAVKEINKWLTSTPFRIARDDGMIGWVPRTR